MPTINTEQSKTMLDCVLSGFPNRKETVKELFETSPTFREISADYDEMTTWIKNNCQSDDQPSGNCAYALEVLKDLEDEIIDCLEGNNKIVSDERLRFTEK